MFDLVKFHSRIVLELEEEVVHIVKVYFVWACVVVDGESGLGL